MRIFVIIFAFILLAVFVYTVIELNRQKNKAKDNLSEKKRNATQKKLEGSKQNRKNRDEDQELKF